ncbi:zinc-ribbon domain-containing protein [Roseofilum sp. BLCC_M154]|uniref:Zinc-ribbon domain-containing protein n=1 Tax=Roseofilum acuticapitatum BLCC-M154 TaxID=3022444 RepID=A0ABT7AY57_9CYAN|nr:zinc-ribbon domain-containing protein [Roseofilum acuticapitatum]MDJ1171841.1 zinc-ribbon domain-containing protein [Roseofilum acuticapitatum BLCC-M154]
MTYMCDLGSGHRIYLENQGMQTVVTAIASSPGQQQQSSNSWQTGSWSSAPEVFATGNGVVIKIKTSGGDRLLQVQGMQMGMLSSTDIPSQQQAIALQTVDAMPNTAQPMQPMKPMEPMKMGNMEMSFSPMQMKMGNMDMQMGSASSESSSSSSTTPQRRFCSQCGAAIKPEDRFCSSCGHRLG